MSKIFRWLVRVSFFVAAVVLACAENGVAAPSGQAVSGTIECDEVRLASRYGGRVARLCAQEGDVLPPATLVAELDAPELKARLEAARAALEEAVAGPRPEEIAAARSEWDALKAELEYARRDAQRIRKLFEQGTLTQSECEAAESKATYLEESANAARKRYELLLAGTRAERIRQARAQVAELEALAAELRVLSPPTTSALEVLSVREGDVVAANREIGTVLLENSLYVRVFVPAAWLGALSVGEKIAIRPDSAPTQVYEGVIEQIARGAEFTPRNVQTAADRVEQVYAVKIGLPAVKELRAGMTVVAEFPRVPAPPPEFQKSGRYAGKAAQR